MQPEDLSIDCSRLAKELRESVEIEDRSYRMKTYKACFVGREAVDSLVSSGAAHDRLQAVALGNVLLEEGYLHHVLRDHEFKDEELFYRFSADEDHGTRQENPDGRKLSWGDLMGVPSSRAPGLQAHVDVVDGIAQPAASVDVSPMDEHNLELLDNVHPRGWEGPSPDGTYDMVVIGAGTGGLVTAAGVAGLGGRVALIEKQMMGGDCLNTGCVPSKALIRCAQAAHEARHAGQFGVQTGEVTVDFGAVMKRMRRLRAQISHHDSVERFANELGIDVFIGEGHFTGKDTVEVNGVELKYSRACIATGGRPFTPPVDGIEDVEFLTNHSLFNLTERPARLGIVGAGPIGAEMAQAFQRLGSQVTLFERGDHILEREDADAAALVQAALIRDGVKILCGSSVARVDPAGLDGPFGGVNVRLATGDIHEVDALLVSTGRTPNVEGIGLEEAGIEFDLRRGIEVDDRLRTSNSRVFAVGDVATRYKFTHVADFMARQVVRNAFFFGREKFGDLLIPWCTYTDPEIAHVGLYPRDLGERGIEFETFERKLADVDRAKLEGETEGFVRIHVKHGTDEIVGATIVARDAGNLISELSVAMQAGFGLGSLADVIHPYPTVAEAIRQAGDAYNRTRLTPRVKSLLRNVIAARR